MAYVLENSKVVRVPVQPGRHVVARRGAMLAYTGQVAFYPAQSGQAGGGGVGGVGGVGGIMGMAGRAMAGESSPLMVADGSGEVLYGYAGLHITLVEARRREHAERRGRPAARARRSPPVDRRVPRSAGRHPRRGARRGHRAGPVHHAACRGRARSRCSPTAGAWRCR
ncbi:hypothetical protein GCM10025868_18860 [Angustibacter aerolatus]|uniref:AIM24 family protein n=1 Tax=Angustibacter aerolatus TaxID=1162965 RepID=A0ABQ6JEK5_9ACTN|nr:AIM24 family protein [Angustibacter aerolatus]GMA86636.1 hypothetical protein GCM10025868_18860 [Angustibacter aerolatus]